MNVQEFAALKAGDQIVNAMSHSRGEVVEANAQGVSVRWHGGGMSGAGTIRHYSVQSTIWFHWSLAEPEPLPLAVRLRDEEGPPLPQMVAQRRAQLAESNVSPELDRAISDELTHPPASIMRDA